MGIGKLISYLELTVPGAVVEDPAADHTALRLVLCTQPRPKIVACHNDSERN